MVRTIASLLALFLFVVTATVSAAAADDNPVVREGVISNTHGSYPNILKGEKWTHVGVDIAAGCGSKVYAFADGVVSAVVNDESDWRYQKGKGKGNLGFAVTIQHPATANAWNGKPFSTVYLHLIAPPLAGIGDPVTGGKTVIGQVGKTPNWKGCHTHFEVRYFNDAVDGFWNPRWGISTTSGVLLNIYGEGDQRQSEVFLNDWEDPEALLKHQKNEEPAQLSAAPDLDYYPLNEGQTKTFNVTQVGTYQTFDRRKEHSPWHNTERTRLLKPRLLDSRKVFPYQYENGFIFYLSTDANGVGVYGEQSPGDIDPKIYDTPIYSFRYPLVVGNSWEMQDTPTLLHKKGLTLPNIVMRCEILMIDDIVTISAGTFDKCLRIRCSGETKEQTPILDLNYIMDNYYWFAPNVGFIKGIYKQQFVTYRKNTNIVFGKSYETVTKVLTSSSAIQ